MTEQKTENYRLLMTIDGPNLRIEGVRCKIYLPETVTDPIQLQFFPTEAQRKNCQLFEGTVHGEIKDSSGTIQTTIQAQKVYFPTISTTHWGFEKETLMIGKPINLQITRWFHGQNSVSYSTTQSIFWLTPSIMLTPHQIVKQSYTGNVTVETVQRQSFTLRNGLSLNFSNHFRYGKNTRGERRSFPELVAEFEQAALIQNPESVLAGSLEDLDDFLLIVSFAARQRCICVGWEMNNSDKVIRYYRRDVVIPLIKKDHSFNHTLVDPSNFNEFIATAYPRFLEFAPKDFLRQVLWKVTAETNRIEERILTLFSALETMVLWFRQTFRLETILCEDQWEEFSTELRKWLKTSPYLQDKEMRKYVYEKIPELNRVSLASAFNRLCEHYSIDLHDLWPVFGDKEGISLSSLRNKLIHGTPLNPLNGGGLLVAHHHLQWIVERLLLAVFNWPARQSRVWIGHMEVSRMKNWRDDRRLLSETL